MHKGISRRSVLAVLAALFAPRARAQAIPKMFAVVYGTSTNIIRRIIESDSDAYYASVPLKAGESIAVLARAAYPVRTVATLQAAVGAPTQSARCAKIDATGAVVGVIQADPTVDPTLGAYTIVQSDIADTGDRYVAGKFQRQYAVASAGVIQSVGYYDLAAPQANAGETLYPAVAINAIGQPPASIAIAVPATVAPTPI